MQRIPSTRYIPPTSAGVDTTLGVMRRMVRTDAGNPLVRQAAADLQGFANGSGSSFACYLRDWLTEYWLQRPDPFGVELLRPPSYQLRRMRELGHLAGDCDDVAVLGGALGRAAGLRARFVAVSIDPSGVPGHVWTELSRDGGRTWCDLDILRPAGALPAVTSAVYVDV